MKRTPTTPTSSHLSTTMPRTLTTQLRHPLTKPTHQLLYPHSPTMNTAPPPSRPSPPVMPYDTGIPRYLRRTHSYSGLRLNPSLPGRHRLRRRLPGLLARTPRQHPTATQFPACRHTFRRTTRRLGTIAIAMAHVPPPHIGTAGHTRCTLRTTSHTPPVPSPPIHA